MSIVYGNMHADIEESGEGGVPQELHSLVRWIVQGVHTVKTDTRSDNIERSTRAITQQIVQSHKSNRQLSYELQAHNRSSSCGDMRSVWSGKQCVSHIAAGVQQNMESHDDIYFPPELNRQQKLRFPIDNIDATVDIPGGNNSFHATAKAVYQRHHDSNEPFDMLSTPTRLPCTVYFKGIKLHSKHGVAPVSKPHIWSS